MAGIKFGESQSNVNSTTMLLFSKVLFEKKVDVHELNFFLNSSGTHYFLQNDY